MKHKLSCPAYSNYQPPYEDCNCGAETMTNLKEVQGLNIYCGPAVLSALTGKSTDECASVISSISGQREIKAVQMEHLLKALDRLGFSSKEYYQPNSILFGALSYLSHHEGMYVITVPHHVVAVEVVDKKIYLIDNHSKSPINAAGSARLTQKVERVWRIEPKPAPVFLRDYIKLKRHPNSIDLYKVYEYVNPQDNTQYSLGYIRFKDKTELDQILYDLHSYYESGESENES